MNHYTNKIADIFEKAYFQLVKIRNQTKRIFLQTIILKLYLLKACKIKFTALFSCFHWQTSVHCRAKVPLPSPNRLFQIHSAKRKLLWFCLHKCPISTYLCVYRALISGHQRGDHLGQYRDGHRDCSAYNHRPVLHNARKMHTKTRILHHRMSGAIVNSNTFPICDCLEF